MRRSMVILSVVGALSAIPRGARAQDLVLAHADSLVGEGDSLAALRSLDAALVARARDASLWHRRGMIAWKMSGAEKRTGFMKRHANDSLLSLADSSLRLATVYGPHSPAYLIDLGRFYLTSNSAKTRGRSTKLFEEALRDASKAGDEAQVSRASDELGMRWWRRYEDRADRHIYSFIIQNVKDRTFIKDPRSIAYFIDNLTIRAAAQDWSGQLEYWKAQELFADAIRADPDNERAQRHMYMLLADRQRWVELQHAAQVRLDAVPADGEAWLALGLATHRLHDERDAGTAFDSALKYLPASTRERFDRLWRIFTPKDSAQNARLPEQELDNVEKMYWLMADPLWVTNDNEHRSEFLSRVEFAELRFSVDEFGMHGADTDRGEVYVRYGPPPAVISFPPDPDKSQELRIRTLWWYSTDEAFLFRQLQTYGVSTLDPDDARELNKLRDTVPVVWLNAGEKRLVDTIQVQQVHFRALGDSGDVFIAARLPLRRMIDGVDLARGALELNLQAYSWRAEPVFDRKTREVIDFRRHDSTETHTWRERLRAGTYLFRVEALQPDAMRGARAASRIEVADAKGFGLSDVLVAATVAPERGTTGARWSDFDITPNLGRVRRGQPFALLWETYGLGADKGTSRYQVSITVERVRSGGGIGAFAARVIGGVASAIGLAGNGENRVALHYSREVPAAPVSTDYLAMDLGTAPSGTYRVKVDITDQVTGRVATQESTIAVVE